MEEPKSNIIKLIRGNIFDSKCEAWVNPVNCMGAMGAGLALKFKEKFPGNYRHFNKACRGCNILPGTIVKYNTDKEEPEYILNLTTKDHWENYSKLEYIISGMKALIQAIQFYDIESIAIPALGCGLGGLQWRDVKPIIENAFTDMNDLIVEIYEPIK